MKPLPIWVPTVYQLHHRIVDVEGYVNVLNNRYSVPYELIGHRVEVRETRDRIQVFEGHREVANHVKVFGREQRVTEPSHRPPRGQGHQKAGPCREEVELLKVEPQLQGYIEVFRKRHPGRQLRLLKRLLSMVRDYPRQPFLAAIRTAQEYGMFDLERLDAMVLKRIATDYFVLETTENASCPATRQALITNCQPE
jgi:hypothetical protein